MSDKAPVLVIGSGAAGTAAARYLARHDVRPLVVESDRLGGTSLWRGCIPNKALYTSAAALRFSRKVESFGVDCSASGDWQGALAWKWHTQETCARDQEDRYTSSGIEVVHGTARFVSPESVEVDGVRHEAEHFVIATGSEPFVPADLPGRDLVDTSDDALHYPSVPKRLVVVGGGFVAAELGSVFATFGSQVTILTAADRLLEMLDSTLSEVATRRLEALGVEILVGCHLGSVEGSKGDLRVTFNDTGGYARTIPADRVLMAIGRRPAVADLNLEAAYVETDDTGRVVVDSAMRTTNPQVWIAGDAGGGKMHTPVAILEGRAVARSIVEGDPYVPDCRAVPMTCFTVPQVGSVGLTESQAREAGYDVEVVHVSHDIVTGAVIADERDGFTRVVSDRAAGSVLGVQIAGPNTSDVITAAAVAVCAGMKTSELASVSAVYPTLAEALFYPRD